MGSKRDIKSSAVEGAIFQLSEDLLDVVVMFLWGALFEGLDLFEHSAAGLGLGVGHLVQVAVFAVGVQAEVSQVGVFSLDLQVALELFGQTVAVKDR